MTTTELLYELASREGIKPTEIITISQWADKYRWIPSEGGSKEPGQWRTSRFPFLREAMDNLSLFSGIQETIMMTGTQVGKTEVGINFFGYTCHIDPSNFLILMPTLTLAQRRSKTKIKPTVEQTPVLRERIAPARERDSDNTTLMKAFPGGMLIISGANSAASLSDYSAKKIHMDEIDRYEMDLEQEGDTIYLAMNRADAFGSEKKILITSTPTLKGFSKIEREFENSDQRHYYVPCPFCKHKQYLRWKDGKWNGSGDYRFIFTFDDKYHLTGPVTYRCEACDKLIPEYHKTWMFREENGAEWRPHNPGHRRRGYKLPSFYSPLGFYSWSEIVQQFLDAYKKKDIEQMKTWKNTRLAETWDEENDATSLEDNQNLLLTRRENYGPVIPLAGLVLVAGADVQRDRIEINVAAFGQGEEWWNMEYKVIPGSIAEKSVHQELDDYFFAPWLHESGAEMKISRILIDSGDGVNSQEIYDYVRPRQTKGVIATKGSQFSRKPIIERSKKVNIGGIRHYMIGTDTAKDSFFARLAIARTNQQETELFKFLTEKPVEISPMYVHFNMNYDEEFFLQLLAEVVKKEKKGRRYVRYYKQIRERNEALDTAVLCLAAVRLLRPNFKKIIERITKNAKDNLLALKLASIEPEANIQQGKHEEKIIKKEEKIIPPYRRRQVRPHGNWITGWR